MDNATPDINSYQAINESLLQLRVYMENELQLKNDWLKRQQETIESLLQQRGDYKRQLHATQQELKEALQTTEGKKQLVDKLLGDIARLQQDIEWYKKTYEERSFLGTILEKIKRKF
jgi:peptidoglycan hydrolase CwlO-like protein